MIAGVWRCLTAMLLAASLFSLGAAAERGPAAIPEVAVAELSEQARQTIALIRKGGPYPYERDGIVFGNFEKLLPLKERGYYREYTVSTPGMKSRGAWRIVAGRGGELYYTDDHYQSFKRIKEP
ncbi:MAG: ribonuclease domain-containing protein [Burkholderiales bacterium]